MVAVFPQVRSGKGNDNVCNIINLVKKHSLSEYATMSEMVILVKSEQNAILGNKEINIEEFKKSLNSFDFFNNDNYVNNSNVDLFDYQNRYIMQIKDGFKFSLDSLLLAEFVNIRKSCHLF